MERCRLRDLLKEKNITKKALIEEAGITQYVITKLENGKGISSENLAKICEVLGCQSEDIIEAIPTIYYHFKQRNYRLGGKGTFSNGGIVDVYHFFICGFDEYKLNNEDFLVLNFVKNLEKAYPEFEVSHFETVKDKSYESIFNREDISINFLALLLCCMNVDLMFNKGNDMSMVTPGHDPLLLFDGIDDKMSLHNTYVDYQLHLNEDLCKETENVFNAISEFYNIKEQDFEEQDFDKKLDAIERKIKKDAIYQSIDILYQKLNIDEKSHLSSQELILEFQKTKSEEAFFKLHQRYISVVRNYYKHRDFKEEDPRQSAEIEFLKLLNEYNPERHGDFRTYMKNKSWSPYYKKFVVKKCIEELQKEERPITFKNVREKTRKYPFLDLTSIYKKYKEIKKWKKPALDDFKAELNMIEDENLRDKVSSDIDKLLEKGKPITESRLNPCDSHITKSEFKVFIDEVLSETKGVNVDPEKDLLEYIELIRHVIRVFRMDGDDPVIKPDGLPLLLFCCMLGKYSGAMAKKLDKPCEFIEYLENRNKLIVRARAVIKAYEENNRDIEKTNEALMKSKCSAENIDKKEKDRIRKEVSNDINSLINAIEIMNNILSCMNPYDRGSFEVINGIHIPGDFINVIVQKANRNSTIVEEKNDVRER